MNKRSILLLTMALLLSVGAATTLSVRGSALDVGTGASTVTSSAVVATNAPQISRPKGNRLGRILSAPFRALAKLFGGKSEDAAETKKKEDVASAPVTGALSAPPMTESANVVHGEQKENERPVGSAREGRAVELAEAIKTRSSEGVRIVRPGESFPQREMWIPTIEGIPRDSLSQGRALLQHGYLNEAIAELSIAATVGPNLVESNNLLGLAYDRRGWHRMAIECYERARSLAPKDAAVLANLGYSLYLDNDYSAALKRLKQAERLMPGVPVIANNIGVVQARRGQFDEAFKSFARASGDYDAHLKMAGIFEMVKRDKDAIKHYEAALRIQPDASAVLEHLAALYDRTGRKTEAEAARRTLGQPKNPQKTTTGGGG